MKIAGFRKTSLIDYPHYISCIIFTQGCNFVCPYCHNPGLIPAESEESYMDLDYFYDFIDKRKDLLDGVVITGGEPTLQEDLVGFAAEIKAREMLIKLDTNGFKPGVIKELIDRDLVDYLAMDIKSTPAKYQAYSKGVNSEELNHVIKKSISLIMNSGLEYEFRTTVVPGMHELEDIREIAKLIEGAKLYFIQNFRPRITFNAKLEERLPFPESTLKKYKDVAGEYVVNVELR